MELTASPLSYELDLINQSNTWGFYYMYEAFFTTEKEDLDVLKVVSVDWIRDYRNAATDEVIATVAMPSGTYLKRILPFKENLKLTLTKTPIGRTSADDPREITVQEFRCFIINANDSKSIGADPATSNEDASNLVGMELIQIQLQELVWEQIRTEMVGGVPQHSTPFDLLIALLWNSINGLDADMANMILGVNSVPPSNKTKRSQFLIPHGVPLTALATLLQTQLGGIYNAGIGCYLQRGYWNVWPIYDYSRFDEVDFTATFIILPDPRLKGTEKTYRVTERQLVAIITGGVSKIDPSEGELLNKGNAVRYNDPTAMMESFVEVKNNKAVAKRTYNNSEYVGVQRRDDSTMSRVTTDMSKTNSYNEASKLAARNGAYFQLIWENSNPDYIVPDLQCEIGFTVNGEPVFINGIVVHAHILSALAGTGLHQQAHQIVTEVVVMVDRNSPEYQQFIESQEQTEDASTEETTE